MICRFKINFSLTFSSFKWKLPAKEMLYFLPPTHIPLFLYLPFGNLRFLSNCFKFDLMANKRQNLSGDTINYSSMQFNCFFSNILFTAEIHVNSIKAETILYTLSSSITLYQNKSLFKVLTSAAWYLLVSVCSVMGCTNKFYKLCVQY